MEPETAPENPNPNRTTQDQVSDYKCLGSWLENSTNDLKACIAHRKLWRIWKSQKKYQKSQNQHLQSNN